MILVDTSVVIDYTKGKDPKLAALMPALPVAVCGITRAELLHGSLDAAHRAKLLIALGAFQSLSIPDALWDDVGYNLATLRKTGITVPIQEAVIATLGITLGIEVCSRDHQFTLMHSVLPTLKLFQEPP